MPSTTQMCLTLACAIPLPGLVSCTAPPPEAPYFELVYDAAGQHTHALAQPGALGICCAAGEGRAFFGEEEIVPGEPRVIAGLRDSGRFAFSTDAGLLHFSTLSVAVPPPIDFSPEPLQMASNGVLEIRWVGASVGPDEIVSLLITHPGAVGKAAWGAVFARKVGSASISLPGDPTIPPGSLVYLRIERARKFVGVDYYGSPMRGEGRYTSAQRTLTVL
ncbi:MAG: hypothetical protein HOO96_39830 [Polyangiaceae bacterium]|nr:hypothetical protein [Polyangiaceae bacterium]